MESLLAWQLTVETGDRFNDWKLTLVVGVCGDNLEVHCESLDQPVKNPEKFGWR